MVKTDAAFLDLKETADFLGVSAATVLQLALEGKLRISTVPSRGNRIHNATQVKKSKESPERPQMAIRSFRRKVALHNFNQKTPYVQMRDGFQRLISKE